MTQETIRKVNEISKEIECIDKIMDALDNAEVTVTGVTDILITKMKREATISDTMKIVLTDACKKHKAELEKELEEL